MRSGHFARSEVAKQEVPETSSAQGVSGFLAMFEFGL